MNASTAKFSWSLLGLVMLSICMVGALGIPEWLVLVTDAPIPWLDNQLPYLLPLVAAFLIFNIAVAAKLGRTHLGVPAEAILFCLFLAAIFSIELGHLAVNGGEANFKLPLGWLWVFANCVVLGSFSHVHRQARAWIIKIAIMLGALIALADILLAGIMAPSWGLAPLGLSTGHLFDSPFVAYLALFVLALVLFDLHLENHKFRWLQYAILVPLLVTAVIMQKLQGPRLMMVGLFVLKAVTFAPTARAQVNTLVFVLLPLVIGVAYKLGVFQSPTLGGLAGGAYLIDDIGVVHGDLISSYVRRETILTALRMFSESPMFGVGTGRVMEISLLGFGLHSNLVFILAATGLAGFCLFASLLFWITIRACQRRGVRALAIPMLLLGSMLLSPKIMWWWSVAIYLQSTMGIGRHVHSTLLLKNARLKQV